MHGLEMRRLLEMFLHLCLGPSCGSPLRCPCGAARTVEAWLKLDARGALVGDRRDAGWRVSVVHDGRVGGGHCLVLDIHSHSLLLGEVIVAID